MKREYIGIATIMMVSTIVAILYVNGTLPSFAEIQEGRDMFRDKAMAMPQVSGLLFIAFYAGVVALSIPLATPLSLLGGYLFGAVIGTGLVVVGATVGATIIFILVRFFFRDFFLRNFESRLSTLNQDFGTHGFRNILFLRLTPLVPFSLINVAAALSKVNMRDYMLGTFLGIIPFAYVYVEAGNQLANITNADDAVPFTMVISRSLIAVAIFMFLLYRSKKQKTIV